MGSLDRANLEPTQRLIANNWPRLLAASQSAALEKGKSIQGRKRGQLASATGQAKQMAKLLFPTCYLALLGELEVVPHTENIFFFFAEIFFVRIGYADE